jgi:hypothetical protein
MFRGHGWNNDPNISMEDWSISRANGGVLYYADSQTDYLQASGAFLLTRNYKTACGYDASQVVDFAIDIGSGGWEARRYVPGNGYGKWHPATDQLVGTDVYGLKGCTTQPWSEEFKTIDFD